MKSSYTIRLMGSVFCVCVLLGCSRSNELDKSPMLEATVELPAWYKSHYGLAGVKVWERDDGTNSTSYGMFEMTQFPNSEATIDQKQMAEAFVVRVLDAVTSKGWLKNTRSGLWFRICLSTMLKKPGMPFPDFRISGSSLHYSK